MPPKKKVAALVKVVLQADSAIPTPSVGTALGPHGVNIIEFVKAHNAVTESQHGNIIPIEITIYENHTFTFVARTPPAAELIKRATGIQSGSDSPLKNKMGKLTEDQVYEIATMKLPDLNASDVDTACKIVKDTTRSMGVTAE